MGFDGEGTKQEGTDFERKLCELKLDQNARFLVRSLEGEGSWEFAFQQPSLGSGAYVERMPNRTIRKWNNRSHGDTSYIDL
jgi:hypothetical protein